MIVVVCSAIIKRDHEFLFIKEFKPAAAGKWGLPGGKLEEGESVVDCIRREVHEETGFVVTSEQLLRIVNKPTTHEGNSVIKFVFICEIAEVPQTAKAEHEYEFLDIDRLHQLKAEGLIRGNEVVALIDDVLAGRHTDPELVVAS